MLQSIPQPDIVIPVAAFTMGVIVAKLGGIVRNRRINGRRERDPRDANIRSLEAELRIARRDLE